MTSTHPRPFIPFLVASAGIGTFSLMDAAMKDLAVVEVLVAVAVVLVAAVLALWVAVVTMVAVAAVAVAVAVAVLVGQVYWGLA